MFQLVYLSFTSDGFDSEKDIDDILHTARKFNPEHGITGMLLYKGGVFLQLLEGEKGEVLALFDKISNDERHKGVKLLVKAEGNDRLFTEWSMGYKKAEEIDFNLINAILPWADLVDKATKNVEIDNQTILDILKKFRYQLK